jgi:SAM-dependent methyltransferase
MKRLCPLCSHNASLFFKNEKQLFYQCNTCKGIFADKKLHLNNHEEKARYKHHKNHIDDLGYIQFADPIISSVKKYFNSSHKGLDFGVGHTPVISEVLKKDKYQLEIYDPLFFNNKEVLKNKYDFIVSCEVIEHFFNPLKEFTLLTNLLKPQGKLFCMTFIYKEDIDFEKWFYKNDPTHVFLYQKETFLWIAEKFKFQPVKIKNRLVVLSK